jgi:S-formylglutathione hydrolase
MLELFSEHACFGGTQRYYRHQCSEIGLQMRFSGFLPPAAAMGKVPALFYLAGLTCNEDVHDQGRCATLRIRQPVTLPTGGAVSDEQDFAL